VELASCAANEAFGITLRKCDLSRYAPSPLPDAIRERPQIDDQSGRNGCPVPIIEFRVTRLTSRS